MNIWFQGWIEWWLLMGLISVAINSVIAYWDDDNMSLTEIAMVLVLGPAVGVYDIIRIAVSPFRWFWCRLTS
jgi:hypothetical protein